MAHVVADRIRDTTTTEGIGNITVSGAAPDTYFTLSSAMAAADTFDYLIAHRALDEVEFGIGTYSSENVFARTTVKGGSNGTSAVNFSVGTKDVFLVHPARKARMPLVQTFDADGTWTKPDGATMHRVLMWGGGGGGASGGTGAAGAGGGWGGGGGAHTWREFLDAELGATVAVTVGVGGAGGPANTGDDEERVEGEDGTDSKFGAFLRAPGGGRGGFEGGVGVGGGMLKGIVIDGNPQPNDGTGGSGNGGSVFGGGRGGENAGGTMSMLGGPGGGGGADYEGSAAGGFAAGGVMSADDGTMTGQGSAGGAGDGDDGVTATTRDGGGGGGTGHATNAGRGGDGFCGGGGGGGGGAQNGNDSGAGGNGGNGRVIVISF